MRKMIKKTLAWWDSNNYGDALNPYIFWAFGVSVSYRQSNTADFLALGSLMERIFKGAHTIDESYFSPKVIHVWGSGVHFESGQHIEQPNIEIPEKLIRAAKFRAVRGKITKKRMEVILNHNLPEKLSLGDPALLMSKIIRPCKKKKYNLGIVSHFHDASSKMVYDIAKRIDKTTIIDIRSDPVYFTKKLTQCRVVISTALHPIIVADSYGIPNMWITTGNHKISSYKFSDYYSVYNIYPPPCFDLRNKIFKKSDYQDIKARYSVRREDVSLLQEGLIRSFPEKTAGESKLEYLNEFDIFRLRWREIKRDFNGAHIAIQIRELIKRYGTMMKLI